MRRRIPFWRYALAVLGGVAAYLVVEILLHRPWIELGLRRPVQEWMIAHGLPGVGYVGVLYLKFPSIVVHGIGGAIVGRLSHRHWARYASVYAAILFLLPWLYTLWDGWIFVWLDTMPDKGLGILLKTVLFDLVPVPFAIGAAWLTSRPKRRWVARLAAGLCVKCGYDLTGNVSGVCPECGKATGHRENSQREP